MKRLLLFLISVCLIAGVMQTRNTCVASARTTSPAITPLVAETITVSNTTPTQFCGSKGTSIEVSFTSTGTFSDPNFRITLIAITRNGCGSPVATEIKNNYSTTGSGTISLSKNIAASTNPGCNSVVYKVVVKNGDIVSPDYAVSVLPLPEAGPITIQGATNITVPGQTIDLTTVPDANVGKLWYSHSETEYWSNGTPISEATEDNVTVTPQTSTYYSVVYKDNTTQCANRSSRVRIPFAVTVSGTNTGADLVYAEGRGVHLDASGIVSGTGDPYPQFYIPSGADANTKVYSTVFATNYPAPWNGYFIIRKSDYWEIYYGSGPMYSPPSYSRVFHTKSAFPTSSPAGRISGRASAELTGTRPPENAVWIKDDDNSEVTLSLTGVSEDNAALPVTLTYFNAKINTSRQVELKWETASERNSDYFEVERSADLKVFEAIAKVKAKDESSEKTTYQFTDENPIRGVNYYRLKQVDLDGTSQYYRAVSVRTEGTDAPYPNPSAGKLLNLDVPSSSQITIQNLRGENIYFDRQKLSESSVRLIPRGALSPGLYIVTANGISRKWMVQ